MVANASWLFLSEVLDFWKIFSGATGFWPFWWITTQTAAAVAPCCSELWVRF